MSTSSPEHTCPRCGGPLPGAPDGLCPRCLMAEAMEPTRSGEATAPAPTLTPEELAPHFPSLEIVRCLGRGGMGVVYEARQKSLNRRVALKLLAPERADDPRFAARFEREAQALAALSHPHIVAVHDFGRAGGFYYLLMEFVDGLNLRQLLRSRRLSPREALAIVPPVCDALQCAHDHGIVHRDIKPENLLIDRAGTVKIADFGIAALVGPPDGDAPAADGAAASITLDLGTPAYAAPEQASGEVDARADIYSLCVVLYEMLTGELPSAKLQPPSRKVRIDVRLDEIVLRALESKPELRFQTASDFRTQVESIASPPPARPGAPRTTVRSIALAVLLLLLGILIPAFGIRIHNSAIGAAAEDHAKNIRGLQGGVTSLSPQMGEAYAVAGRAASRAGNSAEREEIRAQAREEQLIYEQRSVNLQADLDRLQAALAVAGNQRVDAHPWRFVSILVAGFALMFVGGGRLVQIRRASVGSTALPPPMPTARRPYKHARLLLLIPLLIFGVLFVKFVAEVRSPSGVTSFHVEPVEVRDNIVVVDVTAVVARGNAEMRSMLTGSRLPAAAEAALQDVSFAPFAVVLIKPTPLDGNPAWRILSPGRQRLRLGFALPDAALAKAAFDNLRPIVSPPAESGGLAFAGTLFEVTGPDGGTYHAALEVGPPLSSADPRWVEVLGHSQHDASTVTLSWDVSASRLGLAQFSRTGSPIMVLKRRPQAELYSVTAGIELTRLDADRVLFVRRIGHHTLREEIPGNFRDLADELLRTKTTGAKTMCGTTIELCQFQGKPFTVQVQSHARVGPSAQAAPARIEESNQGVDTPNPAEPKSRAGAAGQWGDVLEGVQASLRAERDEWGNDETPAFKLAIRNQGGETADIAWHVEDAEVEIDGRWYLWSGKNNHVSAPLAPGGRFEELAIVLDPTLWKWRDTFEPLILTPGSHTIRVSMMKMTGFGPTQRIISNAVKINVAGTTLRTKTEAGAKQTIPQEIDFKVLRVENPPGTRNILLHFERDSNHGLAIEVWQDVTRLQGGPGPAPDQRDWRWKEWVGVNDPRVLRWVLPQEFTPDDAKALAKEMERKWIGSHPLPDGAVPEFAAARHRDGWKFHLVARVLREPGSPRPPAPAGALFTAEQRIILPADAAVRVTLDQSANDGPKTRLGEELVFKSAPDRATGIVMRWHAYPAQQGKFGNHWILDLVDPDTGVIFHRMENHFAMPALLTSPNVPPFPLFREAAQLAESGTWVFIQLLRAEEPASPGAAPAARWDVFATVKLPDDQPVPAFQLPPAAGPRAPLGLPKPRSESGAQSLLQQNSRKMDARRQLPRIELAHYPWFPSRQDRV